MKSERSIFIHLSFLSSHDSIRRLESFTKDALSISKMIDERERMMHHRSRSIDSNPQRSRQRSFDPPEHQRRESC